ncbi:MAG: ImmA/IrrE family metallo-endopeptidase [Candidatus Marinimicrobia bacterium]|nr:ImmA/IrrE family metallo-endopeptidase [Candidatus Neomarinimicrobiota bacterium]
MIVEYKIKKAASEFRTRHGIGAKDQINFKSLLQKLNIITVFKPISSDLSGIGFKVDTNYFILVNSNQTVGRQNFTIAHELYHLFIEDKINKILCTIESVSHSSQKEKRAELFASYLLIPEEGLLEAIPREELSLNKISLQTILNIEHGFQCSRKAILIRLKYMGLIDNNYFDMFQHNITSGAVALGYDKKLYGSGNHDLIIGDYAVIAHKLYNHEVISESNLISYLHVIGIDVKDIDLNVKVH